MGIVTLPSFGSDPATVTASALDGKVDPLATEFNGNIENSNIKSSAAIAYSKLNLATSILNADVSTSAAIVASKLDLSPVEQTLQMSSAAINEAKGSDIASATTTDIGAATGNVADVTGTTTITGLGTVQAGVIRYVQFDGALTLTHNATSLILPGGANITTAAGDHSIWQSEGSGNWRCVAYTKATGGPVIAVAPSGSVIKVSRTQDQTLRTLTHSGSAWGVDTSKPQITEGAPYANIDTAHTASSTSNTLIVRAVVYMTRASGNGATSYIALFKDSGSDALATGKSSDAGDSTNTGSSMLVLEYSESPADTSSHTYKIRLQQGGATNNVVVNSADSGSTNNFGGTLTSCLTVSEVKA